MNEDLRKFAQLLAANALNLQRTVGGRLGGDDLFRLIHDVIEEMDHPSADDRDDAEMVTIKMGDFRTALDFLELHNGSGRRAHAYNIALGRKTWEDWNKS